MLNAFLAQSQPAVDAVTGGALDFWVRLDAIGADIQPYLDTGKLPTLAAIVVYAGFMFVSQAKAKRGQDIPIRRIAGLDALDEAIGRATEMGRPVLYVPGIDEIKEI